MPCRAVTEAVKSGDGIVEHDEQGSAALQGVVGLPGCDESSLSVSCGTGRVHLPASPPNRSSQLPDPHGRPGTAGRGLLG